jgi:hypothetical protein
VLASINLSPGTFLAIVIVSAAAGTLAALITSRGLVVPVVVVELLLGVVLGPHIIGLHVDQFITFFSDLGLGLLFFFAGYEIDLHRITGKPLRLALMGWAMSLVLAYTVGGILAAAGIVLSLRYTGSALSTTAIGSGPGGRRRGVRGALLRAHHAAVRADAREQLAAGRALDRRARLRPRAAGLRTGTRPAARRLRGGHHHAPGAQDARDTGV